MMVEFGHNRNSIQYKGTVLLGVLLLPEGFEWSRGLFGVNKWWVWGSNLSSEIHWSNTSCSIWAAPWLRVLAHEIGHCFALWHSNDFSGDWNYDGADDSIDLMGSWSSGAHLNIRRLRDSNAARVRQHFRVLSDDDVDVLPPMSPIPTVGRTAID